MRGLSSGRLEVIWGIFFIVTSLVAEDGRNAIAVQVSRDLHGRLDSLDILVVAVHIGIVLPLPRFGVLDAEGNSNREIGAAMDVDPHGHSPGCRNHDS